MKCLAFRVGLLEFTVLATFHYLMFRGAKFLVFVIVYSKMASPSQFDNLILTKITRTFIRPQLAWNEGSTIRTYDATLFRCIGVDIQFLWVPQSIAQPHFDTRCRGKWWAVKLWLVHQTFQTLLLTNFRYEKMWIFNDYWSYNHKKTFLSNLYGHFGIVFVRILCSKVCIHFGNL